MNLLFDKINIVLLLTALVDLGLGGIVFFPRKKINLIYSSAIFTMISWVAAMILYRSAPQETGLFWCTVLYVVATFIPSIFLYFTYFFPVQEKISLWWRSLLIFTANAIIVLMIVWPGFIIKAVNVRPGIEKEIIFTNYYWFYFVYISFLFTFGFYRLYRKYKSSKGMEQQQVLYLLLGDAIAANTAFVTNLILPWIGYFFLNWLGQICTIVMVSFAAYSIIKHRLMDIRLIVARSIAFTILLVSIGIFYTFSMIWLEKILFPESSGTLTPDQIIFRIVLTMIVVFSFQPLKKFITKKTDRVFFKQSYDPEKLLDALSHTMASSIVLIELLFKVMNILIEEMKVSKGFFVLLDGKGKVYTTQGIGYKKSMQINPKDIETLTKDGICIYDDLDEGSRLKNILKKYDVFVAQPLKNGDRVTGVLLLGEKSSGDMYSKQDIRIFEIVGPQVSVAIENAKSYEEIQKFNAVLRSEVKKATTDLERANQNLRELDKAKDEFITMASHQLRTPLTAIKGYLSMLLEGDAGEIKVGQYEFVEEAYSGATRMVALINDLLNVSRMETGRFFLEPTDFELTRLINEEIKQLEKTAKDKGLEIEFTKKGKGDIKLCADEMKVRQVVMNFIDNAIYYTINGKIKVRVSQDKESAYFEVTDNGIGVPKEQQKHLFTKFYRAENARRTRPDGTGLGLFMAKKVIEEHNGEIIFHSEEGRGSTFGFKLPKNANIRRSAVSAATKNVPAETRVADAPQAEKEEVLKYEPEEATVA